ncbi:MAG: hypothetical protein IK095_09275 [Oscillospiraceae bacterium]|nr:hypothetical protein [Oscillospiraceae bacterium]
MKTKKWLIWLAGWLLLILVAGAILCSVLYRYLAVYEIARPELVMDDLMRTMDNDSLFATVKDRYAGDVSIFEDRDALLEEYYQGSLRDAELNYRKDTAASDEVRALYIVNAGPVELARVSLIPAEDEGLAFGMHRWLLESIEPGDILSGLPALHVEIDAAPEQQIFVNGIPLTDDYLVDRALPCPDLTELEQRFPVQPALCRYRIEKMYGDISVTTDKGTVLAPELDGQTVRFYAAGETLHRIEFYAPSDIRLTLCGAELRPEDAVSRSPGILEGVDAFAGEQRYETLHFVLEGLHSDPVLIAEDAGIVLEPAVTSVGMSFYHHANDPETEAALSPYVRAFFDAYTRYSTRAYSVGDQSAVLGRIWPESKLFDYILNSKDTMIWAVTTVVNSYEDLRYTDFYALNDDCYVCTVRYRANMTTNARQGAYTYDEENIAELCFIRYDGRYYCAAMSFLTD